MALTFGAGTGDLVNCGSAAGIDATIQTVVSWCRPTTLTSLRHVISKSKSTGGDEGWFLRMSGTSGAMQIRHEGTTDSDFISSSTPLVANTWAFVAGVINRTTRVLAIYAGSLTAPATELSYSTSITGASFISDASRNLLIGNRDEPTPANAFTGDIAVAAAYSSILTLAEIQDWQFNPRAGANCLGFWWVGFNGTGTQADWTGNGNNGTVTGATFSTASPFGACGKAQMCRPLTFGIIR